MGRFWPTVDGRLIVGDQYDLYQARRFNDTPVLMGTNSDEGALFMPPKVTPEEFVAALYDTQGPLRGVLLPGMVAWIAGVLFDRLQKPGGAEALAAEKPTPAPQAPVTASYPPLEPPQR